MRTRRHGCGTNEDKKAAFTAKAGAGSASRLVSGPCQLGDVSGPCSQQRAGLVFAPKLPYAANLARCRLADLFLDSLPFNAGTTASDALWAGLPLLTCAGEAFAARMAGSLLHAIGLPELITESHDEYEALARALATQPDTLRGFRERLARNRLRAPLFNTDRFRRHLEAAYRTMWERSQRQEAPSTFAVVPLPV